MADEPSKKIKRRVKDPETFRERASRAGGQTEDKGRPQKARGPYPITRPAGLLGRVLLPRFLKNSWSELKLVTWPGWSESRRLTFAVIVFAIIFGLSIAGVDWVLDKFFRQVLLR